MTTIRIVLDTPLITADETRQLAQMVRQVLPEYLPYWQIPQVKVEVSTVIGKPGTLHFYLTEKNLNPSAFGHHGLENGVPAAWISPAMCGLAANQPQAVHDVALWGSIRPALPKISVGGKVLFPGAPEELTKGLAAVLMEEILEAMVDPTIDRYAKDATGTEVLVEVNDHASPGRYVMDIVTRLSLLRKPVHRLVVLPDATLPSFYKIGGIAPYTFVQALLAKKSKLLISGIANAITKPFQFLTGSYAYRKTDGAGQMTYYARKDSDDALEVVEK